MSLFVLVIRLNSLKNFNVIAFVKLRIDRQHLNSDIAEHKKNSMSMSEVAPSVVFVAVLVRNNLYLKP